MRHKTIALALLAMASTLIAPAQSSVPAVLSAIAQNNKTLSAGRQYWEGQKLEFKTGLTLPNPTVEGQYLLGSPAAGGNQVDFFAVQPFELPSTYKKRRQLAEAQGGLAGYSITAQRQDVLLQAKLLCIEMVYRHKLEAHYGRRKAALTKLMQDTQAKLDSGDGNILDVNKTKLQLLEINQLQQENAMGLQTLQTHLTELNGGQALLFQDSIYPALSADAVQSFEQVEAAYEAADPMRQLLEQEKAVAVQRVDLSSAWRLPRFELGYHYQGILGQRFNGIHLGLSLPVWEHKYRAEAQQAQLAHADMALQAHLNEHFFEIKEMYERQRALAQSMEDYRSAMGAVSNTDLLDKALALGQITTIEYFLENSFYQNALLHYLKTERDYHIAVAQLLQYTL